MAHSSVFVIAIVFVAVTMFMIVLVRMPGVLVLLVSFLALSAALEYHVDCTLLVLVVFVGFDRCAKGLFEVGRTGNSHSRALAEQTPPIVLHLLAAHQRLGREFISRRGP